jgi:hypothetical protein
MLSNRLAHKSPTSLAFFFIPISSLITLVYGASSPRKAPFVKAVSSYSLPSDSLYFYTLRFSVSCLLQLPWFLSRGGDFRAGRALVAIADIGFVITTFGRLLGHE